MATTDANAMSVEYGSQADTYQTDGSPLLAEQGQGKLWHNTDFWRNAVWVCLGVMGLAGMIMYAGSGPAGMPVPMALNAGTCGPCKFATCAASECDFEAASFTCIKGPAAGGCADDSEAWPRYSECDACCDLSGCAKTLEAGPEKGSSLTHSCGKCSKEECKNFGGYQRCGSDAPYVCTEGSAMYGCASDKYHWEAIVSTACSKCCDINSC